MGFTSKRRIGGVNNPKLPALEPHRAVSEVILEPGSWIKITFLHYPASRDQHPASDVFYSVCYELNGNLKLKPK